MESKGRISGYYGDKIQMTRVLYGTRKKSTVKEVRHEGCFSGQREMNEFTINQKVTTWVES